MTIRRPKAGPEKHRLRSGFGSASPARHFEMPAGDGDVESELLVARPRNMLRQLAASRVDPLRAPDAREGLNRSVGISTRLMQCVGDAAAGLMLSQLVYWSRRGAEAADGWIWKTAQDWAQELGGMSWKVQHRARQHLLAHGLIEERRLNVPARLEYRIHVDRLLAELTQGTGMDADPETWLHPALAERLFGRGFAWHSELGHLFPLHTAMLCSRLLAGVRWPPGASARQHLGLRFVGLSRSGWFRETGLTRDQWQTARRNLRKAGVLAERQRNFPRRVDLAVHILALAELLRTPKGAKGPYRQDREILPGGFGHLPIQPSQSPDPAFKDLPIPPAPISRSHLQQSQLQVSQLLPQLPTIASIAQASPIPTFGWGGGGGYQRAEKPETGPNPAPADAQDTAKRLHWPGCLRKGDQVKAREHLRPLAHDDQQEILDEIAWVQSVGKEVRSPLALLRSLVVRRINGSFVADGAHRIAEARAEARRDAQERLAARQQVEAAAPVASAQRSPEVMERIQALLGGKRRSA
ncbi:MAG: hypothetical protein QM750_19645 [Rubrivivax sp.]